MKLLERPLELRKDISLAALFPQQFVALKTDRYTKLSLPEWIFDLDYPGQHRRMIRGIRITVKTSPQTNANISCRLTLLYSKYRSNPTLTGFARYRHEGVFRHLYGLQEQMATSFASADSGLFEFAFRDTDEHPFRGAGAISTWKIEFPAPLDQFNYLDIRDVVLHMDYTARDAGALQTIAAGDVSKVLTGIEDDRTFSRLFSLKQDFPDAWAAYGDSYESNASASLGITLNEQLFPQYCRNRAITLTGVAIRLAPKKGLPEGCQLHMAMRDDDNELVGYTYSVDQAGKVTIPGNDWSQPTIRGNTRLIKFVLIRNEARLNMDEVLDELYFTVAYKCSAHAYDTADADYAAWTDGSSLAMPTLAASAGNGQVVLSWNNVAHATSYELKYTTDSTFATGVTTLTYAYGNVPVSIASANGTPVYFKLKAMANGYIDSAYSTASSTPHAVSLDADAAGYLTALSANAIPTPLQQAAINNFFIALKAAGIYSKMVAMYLPVFNNAAAGGWNLVNPVNSNVAHYMTFHGGNTFTANGFYGNGSTGYANPHIDLNLAGFTEEDIHLSGYQSTGTLVNAEIWTNQLGGYNLWSILPGLPNGYAYFYEPGSVPRIYAPVTDSAGFTLGNSTTTGIELYRNGSLLVSANTPNVPGQPQNGMFVNGSMLNTNTIKFLSIGRALVENPGQNKTEVTDFSQAVATLMAAF